MSAKAKTRNSRDALKMLKMHLSLLLVLLLVEFRNPCCSHSLFKSKLKKKSAHLEPQNGSWKAELLVK